MTESRAEEYLFKSIMRDVISLCKGNDGIDEMTHEFGWGLRYAHGYTPEELKRRNFEIGPYVSITAVVYCE